MEAPADQPADKVEEEVPSVPLADHEAAVSAKDDEIALLTEQVNELAAAKTELDEIKQAQAEAEREKKQEALKTFAQAHDLDIEAESVAGAIEELDYAALVAAALEQSESGAKAASQRPMADIAVTDPYGGILGKAHN